MSDTTYNGWPNRATWLVNLHLSNDQGTDNEVRELVAQVLPGAEKEAREGVFAGDPEHRASTVRVLVAAELRGYVEELAFNGMRPEHAHYGYEQERLLVSDLVGQALAHVDWSAIAEHYIDSVREAADFADQS